MCQVYGSPMRSTVPTANPPPVKKAKMSVFKQYRSQYKHCLNHMKPHEYMTDNLRLTDQQET